MEPTTEFDLNDAVRGWRQRLAQSPAFQSGNLAELEAHLRDSVDSLVTRGLTAEEAFLIARRRLGPAEALSEEFGKVNHEQVWLDRALWVVGGMFAIGLGSSLATALANAVLMGGYVLLPEGVRKAGPTVHALGSLMVLTYSILLVALLVAAGRWGRGQIQVCRRLLAWADNRPIQVGVLVALLALAGTAVSSLTSGPVFLRAVDLDVYGTVMMWRSIGGVATYVLLWPSVLAWLLLRRGRIRVNIE